MIAGLIVIATLVNVMGVVFLMDKLNDQSVTLSMDDLTRLSDRRLTEVLHRLNDIQIALGQEPGDPPPLYDVPEEMYDHADA